MDDSISQIIWQTILLLILISLSAFFSAFEASIASLNKIKLKCYYKNNTNKLGYRILNNYLNNYGVTISSILTGNNLVAVAASTLSTLLFNNICLYAKVSDPIALAAGLSTGIITFVLLVFGEYIPKSFGRNNIKFLIKTLYLGIFFYYLFWPISWLLNWLINRKNKENKFSEQELSLLVDEIKKDGVIENDKAFLINQAIEFDNKKVGDVLTPLKWLKSVDYEMNYDQIKDIFLKTKYSRLPVLKNKKFIGMITYKDFFRIQDKREFELNKLIKPILYFSQYTKLDDALRQMQLNKCHIGMVKTRNDSEKVIGIVSLENIIECLVGKIYDEDDDELKIMKINDHNYQINASASAYDVFKKIFGEKNKFWIVIDKSTTIRKWLLDEFKIKKIQKTKYENQLMIININKAKKSKFVVEIK